MAMHLPQNFSWILVFFVAKNTRRSRLSTIKPQSLSVLAFVVKTFNAMLPQPKVWHPPAFAGTLLTLLTSQPLDRQWDDKHRCSDNAHQ